VKTVRLTMAAALVRFLKEQHVTRDGAEHRLIHAVAGIFGHGNVTGLGQALAEHGGAQLPFLQPKNEQAMVHMAVAFAKARRRLSAFACTTSVGPGATNLVTGAAVATINRLPVLLLPGDVFASRRPAPVLQQLEHRGSMDVSVNDCLRPVSRYWDRIQRPEQLLAALPEAMRVLASPVETGAVTLCLPEDVQTEAWDYPEIFFARRVLVVPRPGCDPAQIAAAAQLLRSARRPLIVAGGGVHYSQAATSLQRFVESTGIPVGFTQAGKGALLDDHPLCLGGIGVTGTAAANAIAQQADLVLAVGTRLSDFTTASRSLFQHPDVRWISVQIDPFDASKRGAVELVGDARTVLEELCAALAGFRVDAAYAAEITRAQVAWDTAWRALTGDVARNVRAGDAAADPAAGSLAQAQVIRIVNEEAGPQATIVHAAGGLPGDLHKLWRCRDPDDYHAEYGYSCMGYEIAGALGVKLARPERTVIAMVGDGSYLMLHTELVTSLQEDRPIVVLLIDNGGYQSIHNLQRSSGSAGFGNEFRRRDATSGRLDGPLLSIDYAQNARSLGAAAFTAGTEGQLRDALRAARRERRSALIHVTVRSAEPLPATAWWDVPVAEVSADPAVQRARQAYEAARGAQKVLP
jgi:3D-(3,5/4)-trihydroxycyclohexane-1,2-dione acylhydrolase (decyclizing)